MGRGLLSLVIVSFRTADKGSSSPRDLRKPRLADEWLGYKALSMFSTSDRRDEGQCRRRQLTSVKWRKAVEQAMVPSIAMRVTALLDVRGLHWLTRRRHCGGKVEYTVLHPYQCRRGVNKGQGGGGGGAAVTEDSVSSMVRTRTRMMENSRMEKSDW
jgi:hypothetical protein